MKKADYQLSTLNYQLSCKEIKIVCKTVYSLELTVDSCGKISLFCKYTDKNKPPFAVQKLSLEC
jgi:hypothetical protein